MNPKTTEIKEVDDAITTQWDDYVNAHPFGTPYHNFAWGQAVKEAYGFNCIYICAFEDEQIVGVFPIVNMRSIGQRKQMCALPYCDLGGPLGDDERICERLKSYALELADAQKIESIEIRNVEQREITIDSAPENRKVRMLLSLPESADELMKSFKSKLRSQIRKAEKNGLTSSLYNHPIAEDKIASFYEVIASNMKALGSPVHSYQWYLSILRHYGNNAFISLVYYESKVVGAALVLVSGNKAVIPWASTLNDYNRLAPNMLLYWSVLSGSIAENTTSFDFGAFDSWRRHI